MDKLADIIRCGLGLGVLVFLMLVFIWLCFYAKTIGL